MKWKSHTISHLTNYTVSFSQIKKIWVESLSYDEQSNDLALIQLDKSSTIKPAKIDIYGIKSKAYGNGE